MGRGYYSSSLLAFLTLTLSTMAVVLVFVVIMVRGHATEDAEQTLLQAHQTTIEVLALHDRRLAESAQSLATNPVMQQAFRDANRTALVELLDRQRAAGEIVLIDSQNRVRAATSGFAATRIDARSISTQNAVVLSDEDRLTRFMFAPLQLDGQTMWVGAGAHLTPALLSPVPDLTGVDVGLVRATDGVGVSTRAVAGSGSEYQLEAALDNPGGINLALVFSLPRAQVMGAVRELLLKVAALGFGLVAIAALISSLVLGRIANRFVTAPTLLIRAAVDRVRQGIYTDEVPVEGDDAVGRLARAFNLMQSEIAERESRIVHHAEYDSLTGLTNRGVVDERLRAAFGRAQRSGATLAAMLIDIERFGDINGTMGNETGDAVLKEVARRLASNTRATDLLARVGGDEFLIVVEDMESQLASHITAFIAETLQKPIVVGERSISLTVRIGVALYPGHCETPEGMRRLANVALANAKETSQSVVIYEPGLDERQLRELAILNDLPRSIKENHFELHYQPKLDIKTRTVETVEALIRWTHPQLGQVRPDEFIGLLERHNKTQALTNWILKTAIEQARDWQERGYDIGIAVNLSANDLHDPGLAKRIETMLSHYILEPSRLAVEVTESAVMRDPEQARECLQALRDIGLKIAIDDFGTGQTSLSLLKQLPLNELKIDQSFVRELRTNSGDAIIVKSTIDLGHNMGLIVVAEGVESTYGWNLLKSYKCDVVQGYLVSKPLPATQLEAWYLRMQARQASRLDFSFLEKQPEDLQPKSEPQTIIDILGD
ncbi:MAG: EAL domain-containing protein [Gammaproteobacteria bacterium]|nr:EAL domain-containing protein [Gammaproteobacteria bacterium]